MRGLGGGWPLSSLGKWGVCCDIHVVDAVKCMVSLFVLLTAQGAVGSLGRLLLLQPSVAVAVWCA